MMASESDVERINDRLAREHPIDDYYAKSPLPVRIVEQLRLQIIRRMVGACSGRTLCEIGSGGGHVLAMFRQAKLTAIDVSDLYLDTARRRLAGYDVRFLKGEVQKLALPAQSFDRIVCTEVLEHTTDPESILVEIARLLRRDGVAVITVPNDPLIDQIKRVLVRLPFLGRAEWGGDHYHLHRWRPREFRALLERHFRVEAYDAAPHTAIPLRACFRCTLRVV